MMAPGWQPGMDPEDGFRVALALHYDRIMSEYGLEFVAELFANSGEYQMQIAASPFMQIKFVLEQRSFRVLLARPEAPRTWSDDEDGVHCWHMAATLMAYEDQMHPDRIHCLPPLKPGEAPTLAMSLANWAILLQAYLQHLSLAFSDHPLPGWWEGYNAWHKARLAHYRAGA